MAAGFRTLTEDGFLQIDNNQKYFHLKQKGDLNSSTWVQEPNTQNSGQTTLVISGVDTSKSPVLALSGSNVWCYLESSTTSTLTYKVSRVGSGQVNWFLFTTEDPPHTSGPALIVRNDAGNIVYNSSMRPMRPIGVLNSEGYTGLSVSGRLCAAIPSKQYYYSNMALTSAGQGSCNQGGYPGYQVYQSMQYQQNSVSATFGVAQSGAMRSSSIGPIPYACSPSPLSSVNQYLSSGWSAAIIDVTHY